MTKRLYLTDPYTSSFEGRIVNRVETPDGPALILEGSYFYPDSGGQPHDLGTIDEIPVSRVIERGDDILHVVSRFPDADRVPCHIDRKRRLVLVCKTPS